MLKETSHFVESKVKKLKFQVQVLPTAVFFFYFLMDCGTGSLSVRVPDGTAERSHLCSGDIITNKL